MNLPSTDSLEATQVPATAAQPDEMTLLLEKCVDEEIAEETLKASQQAEPQPSRNPADDRARVLLQTKARAEAAQAAARQAWESFEKEQREQQAQAAAKQAQEQAELEAAAREAQRREQAKLEAAARQAQEQAKREAAAREAAAREATEQAKREAAAKEGQEQTVQHSGSTIARAASFDDTSLVARVCQVGCCGYPHEVMYCFKCLLKLLALISQP